MFLEYCPVGCTEIFTYRTRQVVDRPSLAQSCCRAGLLGGCWAVTEEGDAGGESGRGDQLHSELAAVERPVTAAPDRGVDPEVDLVGEAPGGELVGQFAAAEGDQVPAVLALEASHALGEVALDQRRVPLERFFQGPGGDVLGDAVHPLGETGVVGDIGPAAGEPLVDPASEQERVRGQELIELVPFPLALEDCPVPG